MSAPALTKAIKGFDADLKCRGFQFALGQTFTHTGPVEQCGSGFHACPVDEHPLTVFDYYPPAGSRYCDVTQSGKTSKGSGGKLASAVITIDCEISIGELVLRAWDYVWSRCTKSDGSSATGYQGAASATGDQGAAMAHGRGGRVMGGIDGIALYCTEFAGDGSIASVACGITGEKGIKAGVWYTCRAGKLVVA